MEFPQAECEKREFIKNGRDTGASVLDALKLDHFLPVKMNALSRGLGSRDCTFAEPCTYKQKSQELAGFVVNHKIYLG